MGGPFRLQPSRLSTAKRTLFYQYTARRIPYRTKNGDRSHRSIRCICHRHRYHRWSVRNPSCWPSQPRTPKQSVWIGFSSIGVPERLGKTEQSRQNATTHHPPRHRRTSRVLNHRHTFLRPLPVGDHHGSGARIGHYPNRPDRNPSTLINAPVRGWIYMHSPQKGYSTNSDNKLHIR